MTTTTTHPVVHVRRGLCLEQLHGLGDALEEVTGPHDRASHWRHVPYCGRFTLAVLKQRLDDIELLAERLKHRDELVLEVGAQVLGLQDGAKLFQQRERTGDGRNAVERDINECLDKIGAGTERTIINTATSTR